ncbi:hypothetical protein PIB30_042106 [Stylosanthes scabra]|uniref:PB1-like domain-containing protein n=1 Tax=Stylosanthes scabra TaxID=79078 RepID=A0ABU6UGE2_9FABA|nr:hypothetical protein [Stylosanthes scabra]
MDVDHLNFGDMVKLLNIIEFRKFKRMYWRDLNVATLEAGLHRLMGDAGIRMLCNNVRSRIAISNEFHIYMEHSVDQAHLAKDPPPPNVETVNLDGDISSSSSDDGVYESAEGEAYKPPPPGYEGASPSGGYSSGPSKAEDAGPRRRGGLGPKNSTKVKTYRNEHICGRDEGRHAADQHKISLKIEKRLAIHLHMTKKAAAAFLKEEFKITPHEKMVYRGLRLAQERLIDSEREQYGKIRGYLLRL